MRNRATVRVECEDRGSRYRAAAGLESAGYRVADETTDPSTADLIVRGWTEEYGWRTERADPNRAPVPVLTLHLSLFGGPELVEIVGRALGRRPAPVVRPMNRLHRA